jgi:ABC-type transport system involved in multi-copper enzyme maturation permease subunit
MKELIKGELNKIFLNKTLWAVIGVVLVFQVIIYSSGGQTRVQKEVQNDGYQGYEGEYNIENWDAVANKLKEPNLLHPNNIEDEIETIKLKKEFPTRLDQKIAQINDELKSLDVNSFEYRNFLNYKEMLSKIAKPQVYMDRGWVTSLNIITKEFTVILIILFGVCTIFSSEYSLGTDSHILTTVHGRRKIIYANPGYLKYRNYYIKRRGLDKTYVNVTVALYFMTRMGTAKETTKDFYELTGKRPRTFEEFARDNIKYFIQKTS